MSEMLARYSVSEEEGIIIVEFVESQVLDAVKIGQMEKYPRLKAWCDALMARPSTHSFPEAEFEAMYREGLRKRGSYLSQFVEAPRAAAE